MTLTVARLARIVTMNTQLLKDLSVEDLLQYHPLLNAQGFPFGKGRKVKPIKARPINTILDKGDSAHSVWEKLLLATLEGHETLRRDGFICWGEGGDVWQQKGDKLHGKYSPTEVDADGWTTFVPKPGDDAVMNVHQVTANSGSLGPCGGFCVINPWWGDKRVVSAEVLAAAGVDPTACGLKPGDQVELFLHYGVEGDYVLQNLKDGKDTYRVAKAFYENTYENE
jgi:hypothetical protein